MRVLQIGSDRSKRGSLVRGTPSALRQQAYAESLGHLDDISFTLRSDGFLPYASGLMTVYPTDSRSRLLYGIDAIHIARGLPRPDVVSAQDPFEAGLVACFIAWMKGAPLYVQVHTDFLSPEFVQHSMLNKLRVLIAGFVLRRAARIRVVSEKIKKGIEARYKRVAPVTVLPIFVDVERLHAAHADPALSSRFITYGWRILVVSRLEPEKNIELAIRAFAEAASDGACLIVVGEGSERKRLESLARELKITGHVFFEGEQDSVPYYQLADLVLVPSRYEGYGLVIVEALAAGKPVLSTDVGVAREAGAIVAAPERFSAAFAQWFRNGPRAGVLANYPYKNFAEYVRVYCDDIAACVASINT